MGGSEAINKKKKKRESVNQWRWVAVISVVVVLLAFGLASKPFFFNPTSKSCHCSQGSHKYSGMVEDCCCEYETVDHLNEEGLYPLLQDLVKTPFFRYFKVKLWCDCPFWPEDGMCRLRDCSVCECAENEFPETFKKPFNHGLSPDNPVCQEGKPEAVVDRTIDAKAFKGWIVIDNPWTNDDETDNADMTYVNLQLNPERYTGYTGPSARRIWDAIYAENCPKYPSEEFCQEKKILYKLISGLHSSISVHIAADYLLDEATHLWGQNLTLMYDRVLRYPDRVENLYFTFLFVLRAVTKCTDGLCELQVLGLGTALKILFSVNGQDNLGHTLAVSKCMNIMVSQQRRHRDAKELMGKDGGVVKKLFLSRSIVVATCIEGRKDASHPQKLRLLLQLLRLLLQSQRSSVLNQLSSI